MRLAPCVTLFLAIGLGACGGKPEPAAGKPAGPPATLITTTTAQSIALDVTEDSLGTLEALIDPKIGAEVAGRVIAVHAKAGDRVRQGQLLAEIDPTDFHTQGQADAAEIARLESLVAQAERFAERQQQLVAPGDQHDHARRQPWVLAQAAGFTGHGPLTGEQLHGLSAGTAEAVFTSPLANLAGMTQQAKQLFVMLQHDFTQAQPAAARQQLRLGQLPDLHRCAIEQANTMLGQAT